MHMFSFVGNSDLAAADIRRKEGSEGPGPVARAIKSDLAEWSALTLINDRHDASLVERFADYIRKLCPELPVRTHRHIVLNPASFGQVLEAARNTVAEVNAGDRAFLATPGTSVMGMVWLYLALQPSTCARVLTAHTMQPCAWVSLPQPEPRGRCIILRGLPGAGKSTLAHDIAAQNGLTSSQCIFSTDDGFDEYNNGLFDPALLPRMFQLNLTRFIEAMQRGMPLVVCDNANLESWEFAPYVAAAQAMGYSLEFRLVGDPCDEAEIAACAKHNRHGLSVESLRAMAYRFEHTDHCKSS